MICQFSLSDIGYSCIGNSWHFEAHSIKPLIQRTNHGGQHLKSFLSPKTRDNFSKHNKKERYAQDGML